MSKPGGWPGVCTGGTGDLGGVEDTDATGANGDTDAEEEVKELCRP